MRDYFQKFKSNLELPPTLDESISTRHNSLRDYIKNNNSNIKDTKLIGSLQRKTRIHPGSRGKLDMDIIVVLGTFTGWVPSGGITPEGAMSEIHSTVLGSDRYSTKSPERDDPTITLTYSDEIKAEIVPAYIDDIGHDMFGRDIGAKGRGYWVVKNGKWEIADYDFEAEYISEKNQVSEGYLIPIIKMLKAARLTYYPDLDPFVIEIIASHIIPLSVQEKKRTGSEINYPELLQDFFSHSSIYLTLPLKIPGSKASAITLDATTVANIKDIFGKIAEHISVTNAVSTQGKQIENWRLLFGDYFPTIIN